MTGSSMQQPFTDGGNPVAMPLFRPKLFFPSKQCSLAQYQDGIHQVSDQTGDHHISDDALCL